jgi:polyhydroxyalkanoate synthesis regulator phasin
MIEEADEFIEQVIREAWAATGHRPQQLPPRSDPRMQRMMEHLRNAGRKLFEDEVAHLRRRESDLEQRFAEIEDRVRELEQRVELGGVTLQ